MCLAIIFTVFGGKKFVASAREYNSADMTCRTYCVAAAGSSRRFAPVATPRIFKNIV